MPRAAPRPQTTPGDRSPEEAVRVPPALTDAVGYALRLAQEASFAAYLHRVGNANLKPGRYSILMLIAENPGVTPTALAQLYDFPTGLDGSPSARRPIA